MREHVRGVLKVHEAFIEYCTSHILIESITYEVSRDGRDSKDVLITIDVSGFLVWLETCCPVLKTA